MQAKRDVHFEFMRFKAMAMIVVLHYLNKGGILQPIAQNTSVQNILFWLLEAFCIVAVNVYVLISGYFLVESEWKPMKIGKLIAQILFYTLLIPVIMLITGLVHFSDLTIYDWLGYVFPVASEQYWFITAYVMMYLFAPVLAAGMKQLSKKQFQIILLLLVAFLSLEKTILPIVVAVDHQGYDYGWFLCLMLLAGYIRLYGFEKLEKISCAVVLYFSSTVGIWLIGILSGVLSTKTGIAFLAEYENTVYSYNYILCLTGAVGLFYWLKNFDLRDSYLKILPINFEKTDQLILAIGPVTLGVYLIHEHNLVRYLWPQWLHVTADRNPFLILLHMIGCVIVIFACGVLAEFVRRWIFKLFTKKA